MTLLNNLNLNGVEYEFGGYVTRFFTYDEENGYLNFNGVHRFTFDEALFSKYGIRTGEKLTSSDGKKGAYLTETGRLLLQNGDNHPGVLFYGKDSTESDASILYNISNDYLVFIGATRYSFDASIYSNSVIWTGGKTSTSDGKAGIAVGSNGTLHLQGVDNNPYIGFYGKDQTGWGANITYNVTDDYLYFGGAARYYFYNTLRTEGYFVADYGVYTGGKTSSTDGKTGAFLSQNGRLQLQNITGNPYITFYGPDATGSEDAYISYNITNGYLSFGKATRYTFSARVDVDGILSATNNLIVGNGNGYTSDRYIYMPWADGTNHAIAYRGSDGLTAYFGWSGSSSYATVSVLRARTVKYTNSSGTTTLSDERLKKDFTTLDEWDTFFDAIEPCAFRMKGGNSGRYHVGFKAQQIEQALINCGKTTNDFAGFIRMKYQPDSDDPEGNAIYEAAGIKAGEDELGLVYTEFTAMNTDQIQKLKARVKRLEELVEKLQA